MRRTPRASNATGEGTAYPIAPNHRGGSAFNFLGDRPLAGSLTRIKSWLLNRRLPRFPDGLNPQGVRGLARALA